eukprot:TRINITY_DN176_c0_g1_i1.p1 TRINITY_DN176_c0_g1~~TRINITY_DN176_c0_g1_i1.p1  ORF type:complete len:257 (+),score=94.47 TRINITY_DN176_c0_g1_i1:53-823(+)
MSTTVMQPPCDSLRPMGWMDMAHDKAHQNLQLAELEREDDETTHVPQQRTLLLPPPAHDDSRKLCVVLDLDETLVRFRTGPIYWRPFFGELLDAIKDVCEVVLWTASTQRCASRIMDDLDPEGDRLHHHIYRNDIWFTGVPYTKDLTLLGRPMDRVIIIENTPQCIVGNPANAILVDDYTEPDMNDCHLLLIKEALLEMVKADHLSVPEYLHGSELIEKVPGTDNEGNTMTFYLPSRLYMDALSVEAPPALDAKVR